MNQHQKVAKRAQLFSMDLAISLFVFLIALALAYSMIINTLQTDNYQTVVNEAQVAGSLLGNTGYPTAWTNTTVIRAGLVSDGHLSLRKETELVTVGQNAPHLRTVLRLTDNTYIYLTNQSNTTIPMSGSCGVGLLTVNSTPQNITLPAFAITGTKNQFSNLLNITERTPDNGLPNLTAEDVAIFEGNVSPNLSSQQQEAIFTDAASLRGATFVIIGDPGSGIFGITVNSTMVSNISINGNTGTVLGFATNETINVTSQIPTIEQPTGTAVTSYLVIGKANNTKAAYATWVYNDARIYYLASIAGNGTWPGNSTGTNITPSIVTAVNNMIKISSPNCGTVNVPNATQESEFYRIVPYHNQFYTLHVIVWSTT